MKKPARWICCILFLLLCLAVISFLHIFTITDKEMQYIVWNSAVEISADGTEQKFTPDEYTNIPEQTGTFRFSGTLPEGLELGELMFSTAGTDLTLYLNGTEIYHSVSTAPEGTPGMSQAQIPLPENASGELTMVCSILDPSNAMLPPLVRFIPDGLIEEQSIAGANLYAIPAGIAALALILVVGVFLLSILRKKTEWSLIPLALAAALLMTCRLCQTCGYYFLPENVLRILNWPGMAWLTLLALAIYIAMNRHREFWKVLGRAALWSAVALAAGYVISWITGRYLADYINMILQELVSYGIYDNLLYWITLWLAVVCALISIWNIMSSFAQQQTATQTLLLKNRLILDSYHAIEQRMKDNAAQQHEMRHHLAAMDALYQNKNSEGLGKLISGLTHQNNNISPVRFTENFTVNAILQDAAAQAAKTGISFEACVSLPRELTIPEDDLCIFLMNMLDNALEACNRMEKTENRFIRFKAELRHGFLAVKCENPYTGQLKEDENGLLLTTKDDPEAHGFGMRQMEAIAERYGSLLDISYTDNHIFIVQTALKLPEKK